MIKSALFAALLVLAPQNATGPASAVARGKALTQWTPQSLEAAVAAGSPQFKAGIAQGGGPAGMSTAIAGQVGAEQQVFDEFALTVNGMTTYQRLARYERAPAAMSTAAWDANGVLQGAGIRPSQPPLTAFQGPAPQTALSLPFAKLAGGDWLTFWGGGNAARNYHIVSPDQTHAYDFMVVRNGRTFEGAQDKNESYFCWNQPVLAPAAGKVVEVVDGIADNTPVGAMNAAKPAGNHVIIEHRPGEYSLLGHLKSGSPAVAEGQSVTAGQKIAVCGNSGNSSEPHLHYHLQNTATFGTDARGLPAVFQNIAIDGRRVATGEPVRGQIVAPAT